MSEAVSERLDAWSAFHPRIKAPVWSYRLRTAAGTVFFDPLLDEERREEVLASAAADPGAVTVLLTNRHHYRSAGLLRERLSARVLCHRAGLHEFSAEQGVEGFEPPPEGMSVVEGVEVLPVGVLCPEEVAYYLPGERALVVGDAVVGAPDGGVGFVPDALMDNPEETKAGLLERLRTLLETVDFETVLLAHGGPLPGAAGRRALERLVAEGGRTAFEL